MSESQSLVSRAVHGGIVTVDAQDAYLLDAYTWYVSQGYVCAKVPKKDKIVKLHNLIQPPPDGLENDHKDRNGLNNTRDNLRLATRSQNTANRRKYAGKSSAYRGVSFHKGTGKWQVIFTHQNKQKHLGLFTDERAAARAYDAAAKQHFGEFANLNFA